VRRGPFVAFVGACFYEAQIGRAWIKIIRWHMLFALARVRGLRVALREAVLVGWERAA
jgi:hypothetical protein